MTQPEQQRTPAAQTGALQSDQPGNGISSSVDGFESFVAAERAAVGASILSAATRARVQSTMSNADVADPMCRLIDEAMRRMDAAEISVDFITLTGFIEQNSMTSGLALRHIGSTINSLVSLEAVPLQQNAVLYAQQVAQASARREVLAAATEIARVAGGADPGDLREVVELQAQRAVQAVAVAAPAPGADQPQAMSLRDFLAVVDEPVQYRIDRIQPVGGRVVLAAQFKAGKTTMVGNLIRSYADGTPFLGQFDTVPGDVVLIDDEMDARQLRRWLRDQDVTAVDRVRVLPLRGSVATFDIINPVVRARWANMIRGAQILIFDCLRPVLDALGLDENRDSGRFLVALDALLKEAGVDEAVVVHHMGHTGERSRGDSRIRDWPDVEWRLVRTGDDPNSPRYFTAYGRDVDVPELALTYQATDRRLLATTGNRTDAAAAAALEHVVATLAAATEPMSRNQIETALKMEQPQKAIRRAIDVGIETGAITEISGARGARLCTLTSSPRPTSSSPRQRSHSDLVTSSIEDEVEVKVPEPPTSSTTKTTTHRCGHPIGTSSNGKCGPCIAAKGNLALRGGAA